MKKTTIFIFIILPLLVFGQSDFCEKNFGESYYPLKVGFKKNLIWGTATYVEKVTGKTTQNGVEYYNYEQDFGGGTSYDLLLRKQNDTIFMYNEKEKKDIILLIERPVKGTKWKSGKVIDTDGEFKSPFCNYKNLLVIQKKYPNGNKEKRFYKKGLGLVAVTTKKGIKGMCVPSKEESIRLSKPFSAFGCENLQTKEEVKECTISYINSYLNERLIKRKLKTPKEEGILKFRLHSDNTGKVIKIEKMNSIRGGKQVRKAIMEILYTLPKFRPLMTSEKKSIGTKFELSIPIRTK